MAGAEADDEYAGGGAGDGVKEDISPFFSSVPLPLVPLALLSSMFFMPRAAALVAAVVAASTGDGPAAALPSSGSWLRIVECCWLVMTPLSARNSSSCFAG
jgi:hypothetical protein